MRLNNFNKLKILIAVALVTPLFFITSHIVNASPVCGGLPRACGISLDVNPGPPSTTLNDGAHSVEHWWTMSFETTPIRYTFKITPGHCEENNPAVPGTEMNVDLAGKTSPVGNPEWSSPNFVTDPETSSRHLWNVPAGQAPGIYCGQVAYYSSQVSGHETWAANHFYIGVAPTPTTTPTPTPEVAVTPEPTSNPTPAPTSVPTQPSNPGGPGDGKSDGLGCGSHDCSTHAPIQAVLAAVVMPATGYGPKTNNLWGIILLDGLFLISATYLFVRAKN